ncbi:MAG TPA: hypothetical protein PK788_08190 [Gemmatimonadaceae bacterium]|nr:hypothetical protein [Gemmatimonadaceae bacterium]
MRRALAMLPLLAALVGACSKSDQARNVLAGGSALDSADQVAFNSRTVLTDAGMLRAEIFADTTLFLNQNTRVAMQVVHGVFFRARATPR